MISEEGIIEEVLPPAPPGLRAIALGKIGDASMKFSGDVEFPIAWRQKFDFDQARKLHGIEGARHLAPGSFLGLSQEAANDGTEQGLDPDNISIESLDPRELKFSIKFQNPALISLSDQS